MRLNSNRGFTLVEVVVVSAIFLIIFLAAYLVYETSQVTFAKGETDVDLQQNARVAMDRIVRELRMAGSGATATNPNTLSPAIFDAASDRIGFRADIEDGQSFLTEAAPEGASSIEVAEADKYSGGDCGFDASNRGDYLVITDGDNWEAAQVDEKSGVTLTLCKALSRAYPLGSTVHQVKSIIFSRSGSTTGCDMGRILREVRSGEQPNPPAAVPQPLACNVESLNFRYYDSDNVEIPPSSLTARLGDIRRITIAVTTLATLPREGTRSYTLTSEVRPRNLGL
ncbi:MAG: PilW family protein [Candidatus Methylomirabilales bacterium]